ncbi:hypothetical protein INR49_002828 [Caranx melampygus]|nr:hypothetical protein INR49_002828 [Caranx melampygus]
MKYKWVEKGTSDDSLRRAVAVTVQTHVGRWHTAAKSQGRKQPSAGNPSLPLSLSSVFLLQAYRHKLSHNIKRYLLSKQH